MSEFKGKLTRDQVKEIMFTVLFSQNVCNENIRKFASFQMKIEFKRNINQRELTFIKKLVKSASPNNN